MSSEHAPHARCWMAWPARTEVWGDQLAAVRQDIAHLARTIARFEPVRMLAQPGQESFARKSCGGDIDIVPMPIDDMWLRDSGPIFLTDGQGKVAGSVLNFNGWGRKQMHSRGTPASRQRCCASPTSPAFRAPRRRRRRARDRRGRNAPRLRAIDRPTPIAIPESPASC